MIFKSLLPQLHQLADKHLELDRGDRLLGELRLLLPFRPRRGASLLPPCHLPALHNRHLRTQPQDCSVNDCEMWSYEILNFYFYINVLNNRIYNYWKTQLSVVFDGFPNPVLTFHYKTDKPSHKTTGMILFCNKQGHTVD